WRSGDGRSIRELGRHGGAVTSVAFSGSGDRLVSASSDGTARVWRVATGGLVSTLSHDGPVSRASFSPDGGLVATVSRDQQQRLRARIYDASSGRLVHVLDEVGVGTAKFSPDGSLLATGSSDRTTKLWRPRTGALVRTLPQPDGRILDLAFSPDGSDLATATPGGSVAI